MLTLLIGLAVADEPAPALRLGVAGTLDRTGPLVGLHGSASEPLSGGLRTTVRVDWRTWPQPDGAERNFWEEQFITGLPTHLEGELTGSMGLRVLFPVQALERWDPGVELGLVAGRWHYATIAVQEAYAELGAVKWPLDEYLLGPELHLGLMSPDDDLRLLWTHRYYVPLYGRLDGGTNRYVVGDETFEGRQVVNPRFEGSFSLLLQREHLFGQLGLAYLLVLPSEKNRRIDQAPPSGSVRTDLVVGWAF